jgi:hypothetical protein
MRIRLALLAAVLALASCTASAGESNSATVVLFDVSNSTLTESVRARYQDTFAMVVAHALEEGGALGADVIDDNPLVHGSLPINATFEPCTINDNSLECRTERDELEAGVRGEAAAILETSSRGTDIFGALALAEQFFEAYPDAGTRTLVLLSDMVQSANGMHLGTVEAWTRAGLSETLARAPSVDLSGVRVYVVGAGSTALTRMTPIQIEGMERFWRRWFEDMGASVVFYGANLPRFPITGGTA